MHPEVPFRHPSLEDKAIGELLSVLLEKPRQSGTAKTSSGRHRPSQDPSSTAT